MTMSRCMKPMLSAVILANEGEGRLMMAASKEAKTTVNCGDLDAPDGSTTAAPSGSSFLASCDGCSGNPKKDVMPACADTAIAFMDAATCTAATSEADVASCKAKCCFELPAATTQDNLSAWCVKISAGSEFFGAGVFASPAVCSTLVSAGTLTTAVKVADLKKFRENCCHPKK